MNPLPEDKLAAIREAIFRKQKIVAIKLYREATGVQLVDAKNAVETMEAELRASAPDRFSTVESRGGCFAVALGMGTLVGLALWKVTC